MLATQLNQITLLTLNKLRALLLTPFPLFFVSASVINTGIVIPALNCDHASPQH